VKTIEKERSQIAANIHDGPVQQLTALGFAVDRCMLRLHRGQSEAVRILLEDFQQELSSSITGLRQVMGDLRPPILDEGGLVEALRDFLAAVELRTGMQCTLVDRLREPIDGDAETELYRVAQEAVTNVVKHAFASEISVMLLGIGGGVSLVVEDNGCGFDPRRLGFANDILVRTGHFGLALMRERVELFGGRFEMATRLGAGTAVRAWVPVQNDDGPLSRRTIMQEVS